MGAMPRLFYEGSHPSLPVLLPRTLARRPDSAPPGAWEGNASYAAKPGVGDDRAVAETTAIPQFYGSSVMALHNRRRSHFEP